jgi:hypothetical protein
VTPPDKIRPTIESTFPTDGDTTVALDVEIQVTLSEDIDSASVTDSSIVVSGVAGTVSRTVRQVVFHPSSALAYNREYTVTLDSTICDLAGNRMAHSSEWNFRTVKAPYETWILDLPTPPSSSSGVFDVIKTSDNNFLLAASLHDYMSIIKIDGHGNILWERDYATLGNGSAKEVQEIADGFVVVGVTDSSGDDNSDITILKADLSGNYIAHATIESIWMSGTGQSLVCIPDGGFAVAGGQYDAISGQMAIFVARFDSHLSELWRKYYRRFGGSAAADIVRLASGVFVIGGPGHMQDGYGENWLLQLSDTGDSLDAVDGTGDQYSVNSLLPASASEFLVLGSTRPLAGPESPFLELRNSSLDVLWNHGYPDAGNDCYLVDGCPTSDNGLMLLGYSLLEDEDAHRLYLVKVDASGGKQWSTYVLWQLEPRAIVQASDGGYVIACKRMGFQNSVTILRIGPHGEFYE